MPKLPINLKPKVSFKALMPYLFVTELAYYVLPFVVMLIGEIALLIACLLVIFPILTFICAFISAKKNGFSWLYTGVIVVLFIPTVFMYYNTSALPYSLLYAIASILGNMIGDFLAKKKNEVKSLRR